MPYQSAAVVVGSGNDVCVYTVYLNAVNLVLYLNDKQQVDKWFPTHTEFLQSPEVEERCANKSDV